MARSAYEKSQHAEADLRFRKDTPQPRHWLVIFVAWVDYPSHAGIGPQGQAPTAISKRSADHQAVRIWPAVSCRHHDKTRIENRLEGPAFKRVPVIHIRLR